jgi:hypothetical protein
MPCVCLYSDRSMASCYPAYYCRLPRYLLPPLPQHHEDRIRGANALTHAAQFSVIRLVKKCPALPVRNVHDRSICLLLHLITKSGQQQTYFPVVKGSNWNSAALLLFLTSLYSYQIFANWLKPGDRHVYGNLLSFYFLTKQQEAWSPKT